MDQVQKPPNVTQYPGIHLLVGILVLAGALSLFAVLASAVVDQTPLVQFDQNLDTALHAWATPAVTIIFRFITFGGSSVLWGVAAIAAIILALRKEWLSALVVLVARIGGEWLNPALKNIYMRSRPIFSDPIFVESGYSFPSGHAMASAIAFGILAYVILRHVHRRGIRIAIIAVTILIVLLIGFSRMYLGVHYFSDVVGGYAAGVAWLALCITVTEAIRARLRVAKSQSN